MNRTHDQLREDALAIWRAGVAAVRSEALLAENVQVEGRTLAISDAELDLDAIDRIVVVGTGKAGAGMAAGLEAALGPALLAEKQVTGLISVPADCVRTLASIRLAAGRPAGVNEPTAEGVAAGEEMLRMVAACGPRDLVIRLLSGGGSALLPVPIEGVTLADKLGITRHLSAAGANINELNAVRKRLSRIKGGGLARACRAGNLVTLILSDVLGDPLGTISSGPTVLEEDPIDLVEVVRKYGLREAGIAPNAVAILCQPRTKRESTGGMVQPQNFIIGNNAVAIDAAGIEAVERGYSPALMSARASEGAAEELGRHHALLAREARIKGPDSVITGGEPVVKLVESARRGKGGRNQQLVLAALVELLAQGDSLDGLCLLSGGTDGEDGPTDAAGALIDAAVTARMRALNLNPADYLARNDAYTFFDAVGGLIRTGPTNTNVCDVRVVVASRGHG